MSRTGSIMLLTGLVIGAVEAIAYGWMHPAAAGAGQAVLCYRPGSSRNAGVSPAADPSSLLSSALASDSGQRPTDNPPALIPLLEIYQQAAPILRCSSGRMFHATRDKTMGLHLAFLEWNQTDTGSVLEAFRHMPEVCLGSLGMTLVSKETPIRYHVGGESLLFDHTVFREPGQGGGLVASSPLVHAFRAVWVVGVADASARTGLAGNEFDRLRSIRLKSALTRFRPSHARVIQGTVRGALTADIAWQAFESTMLVDLTLEPSIP
jgi:hypothetical protein